MRRLIRSVVTLWLLFAAVTGMVVVATRTIENGYACLETVDRRDYESQTTLDTNAGEWFVSNMFDPAKQRVQSMSIDFSSDNSKIMRNWITDDQRRYIMVADIKTRQKQTGYVQSQDKE